MKSSDYIVQFFAERGVDTFFGYIGGMVTHLVDSISKNPHVRFIQTYHEQTAAFAAEGYARVKGIPGVAIATSGPGATNMLTSVGNAFFDSIPVIYITGQVNTGDYKYNKPVRQQGFQETDIVSIAKPITKYAVLIDSPNQIRYELEKAWDIAVSGRPGPVLIDLPMNMQRAEIVHEQLRSYALPSSKKENDVNHLIQTHLNSFLHSQKPLILIGGGCHSLSKKHKETLYQLSKSYPTVCSLQGKGTIPEDSPFFAGLLGSYGNRAANMTVAKADAILVLGSRLDSRQTGNIKEAFYIGKTIYHFDVDPSELEFSKIKNRIPVCCKTEQVIEILEKEVLPSATPIWLNEVATLLQKYGLDKEIERFIDNPLPYQVLAKIGALSSETTCFVADIGQNQMWSAQTLRICGEQDYFTSGGMAPMGYALPAAIGMAFADSHKKICVIIGDGGLQMSMQALLLAAQYKLPISIFVMNNQALGMITQFQNLYFDSNYAATTPEGGYLNPNWETIAAGTGLNYQRISSPNEITKKTICPGLIEIVLSGRTTVSPKLEYNSPLYDMTPHLPKDELDNLFSQPPK